MYPAILIAIAILITLPSALLIVGICALRVDIRCDTERQAAEDAGELPS